MSDDVFQADNSSNHTVELTAPESEQQQQQQQQQDTSARLTPESVAPLAALQRYFGATALQCTHVFEAVPKQRDPPLHGQTLQPQKYFSYAVRSYKGVSNL